MITYDEITGHLRRYISGIESLDTFEDWLVATSWNMHKDSDENAQSLVWRVEHALSEHSDGCFTEPQLKGVLACLFTPLMGTGTDSIIHFGQRVIWS